MILSKPRLSTLFLIACAAVLQACSAPPNNQNTSPPAGTPEAKSEFPFSTKEPEVYQGDFFAGTSDYTNHWFVARKGENWKVDFFKENKLAWTELRADKLYLIDHKKKIYTAEPSTPNDSPNVESSYFTSLISGFFKGKEYHEFDDLGREGNLKKYKVRNENQSKDEILLYVDEASGVITKQEFIAHNEQNGKETLAKYSYEIKNLKLNVDDKAFEVPAGYRFVTSEEYQAVPKVK